MRKYLLILIAFILILGCTQGQNTQSEKAIVEREEAEKTEEELLHADKHWEGVFAKALAVSTCPASRDPKGLPEGYYKGPMIDTHIHLQSLPDGAPGAEDYAGENIGIEHSISEWICMMDVEGTNASFGFFPVWDPIRDKSIDLVQLVLEKYPGRFTPFIMPPDRQEPTVVADELENMLNYQQGLFQGYGEIGLYAHGNEPDLPPDSQKLSEIYQVVRRHNLMVYFHPGEGHKKALERAAAANPDIIFIFHGDQLKDCAECDKTHSQIAEILENHPNAYYGVDELYGGKWLLKPGLTKEDFLAHFNDYEALLKQDLETFKEFIESHPDQVLWGTDRGVSNSWDLDPDVALTLNNYSRYFIGHLDPMVQEKLAYKNAEKLIRKKG